MKIAITGHTKGIGKCIKDLLEKDGHEVVGASTSTGINVMRPKSVISWIEKENPDVFVNNVYAPNSQCNILYQLYEKWQYEDKLIINMSSTSGEAHTHFQQMGYNKDLSGREDKHNYVTLMYLYSMDSLKIDFDPK